MNTSPPWKHVWITGASSGLGEHVAKILAKEGCVVSICARSEGKLKAIADTHDNIFAYTADVTDIDRLRELADEIEGEHGPIDLALFCAGAWFPSSIVDLKVENFEKTIDVNVLGVVRSMDAVMPKMLKRGRGHIAWISSVAGYGGLPRSASYGASKSALITLAESVKSELEEKGLDISVVNPGFVKTDMTEANKFPMPFIMEVEDAAQAIVSGLKKKKFEIAFPWQLVTILKILNHLPYWLYFQFTKRML